MKNKGPEINDYSWIWWSLAAIVATAVITVAIIGGTTGNWPWNRGNGAPETTDPSQTVETTAPTADTTVPEETTEPTTATVPEETTEATTVPTEATKPTEPKPTQPKPTTPSKPEETEPEETEPEETQPVQTQPTQPEEDEDEGGGEKPQPGDIDVPIGPRP